MPSERNKMDIGERTALEQFVEVVRDHYGELLHDIVVFGSRARGDNRADSDVDVAVVLEDGTWDTWNEKLRLVDLSDDAFHEHGLMIQAWPVAKSVWLDPSQDKSPSFVKFARRDAKPVGEAA